MRAINSVYKPNKHVKGRPECTIFVSRLSLKTTKETIKEVFSQYGSLRRFRLVKDIVTGMPKGYAFIEYESESAAEEAYCKAHKMNIDGNRIFVDFECERLLKGWRPRRLGGGFGGRKESGQLRFGGRDRPFRKPIALEIRERERNRSRQKNGTHDRGHSSEKYTRQHEDQRKNRYEERHSRKRNSEEH